MNRERLLRLATYMEGVDAQNYDQGAWLLLSEGEFETIREGVSQMRVIVPEGACGTTRCVFGHAPDALPEAGLWFTLYEGCTRPDIVCRDAITGNLRYNFAAASHVFAIPEDHAAVLFGSHHDEGTYRYYTGGGSIFDDMVFHEQVTPSVVAAKLREYVETDGQSVADVLAYEVPDEIFEPTC